MSHPVPTMQSKKSSVLGTWLEAAVIPASSVSCGSSRRTACPLKNVSLRGAHQRCSPACVHHSREKMCVRHSRDMPQHRDNKSRYSISIQYSISNTQYSIPNTKYTMEMIIKMAAFGTGGYYIQYPLEMIVKMATFGTRGLYTSVINCSLTY